MPRRNKLQKFADLLQFPNVYECFDPVEPRLVARDGEEVELRGQWGVQHFGNAYPITLELACGRGEYTIDLARRFAERNFIGIDVKGARIWKGARIALAEELTQAAFVRTRIEVLAHFFAPGEADEIWITFPDPFLPRSSTNRRLTSPRFLELYRHLLPPGRPVHLKTDSGPFYEYTLEMLANTPHAEVVYQDEDIYSRNLPLPELEIPTHYEQLHRAQGQTIKYVRWVYTAPSAT